MKSSSNNFSLTNEIRQFFNITSYMPILQWSQKYIDFSKDVGSERNYFDITLTPHLKEILEATDFKDKIKEVTVCGIEQHGKTLLEEIFLLYSMIYTPCNSLTVYPSNELAADINLSKLRPLMCRIPQLKTEMGRPRSMCADRYRFSNFTSFWQGAGTKIMSKSTKIRIADEIDQWPLVGKMNNVEDLRKRGRSFSQSMYLKVCTPTTENGRIWKQFLKSSQGYWTLYCMKCHEWTMRSCDINNLQFETIYNNEIKQSIVKPETIRLVCPKCGYEHKQSQKFEMNQKGKYIHRIPQRIELNPGFQFGVLCSLFPFMTWERIANKILQSGKTADIDTHIELDNSWRGLPYKRRQILQDDFQKLKDHCWKQKEAPSKDKIEMIFLAVDTQDNRSVVVVSALDVNDNMYILDATQVQYMWLSDSDRAVINQKRVEPIVTVQDMLNKEYLMKDGSGIKPTFAVVDRQGHRSDDVQYFAKRNSQVLMYQGYRSQSTPWKFSQNNKRLCFVSAKIYQAKLIHYLYAQKNRANNYLYFTPKISDEAIKQLLSFRPDNSAKFGNAPENWTPQSRIHDFFDAVKMAYFAQDFALKSFKKQRFRFCKSPQLLRRFGNTQNKQKNEKKQLIQQKKQSWLNYKFN